MKKQLTEYAAALIEYAMFLGVMVAFDIKPSWAVCVVMVCVAALIVLGLRAANIISAHRTSKRQKWL